MVHLQVGKVVCQHASMNEHFHKVVDGFDVFAVPVDLAFFFDPGERFSGTNAIAPDAWKAAHALAMFGIPLIVLFVRVKPGRNGCDVFFQCFVHASPNSKR